MELKINLNRKYFWVAFVVLGLFLSLGIAYVGAQASGSVSHSTREIVGDSDLSFSGGNIYYVNGIKGLNAGGVSIHIPGSVGIGTATPNVKLEVYDSTSWWPVLINNPEDNGVDSGGYAIFPGGDINKRVEYSSTMNGGFRIWTVGSGNMIYSSGGNIGIGTTSPEAKLHVAGDIVSNGAIQGNKIQAIQDVQGTRFCIGGNCIASWAEAGGGSRLSWNDALARISIDGGGNNARVYFADVAVRADSAVRADAVDTADYALLAGNSLGLTCEGCVTGPKIGVDSITSTKITDGQVGSADLANPIDINGGKIKGQSKQFEMCIYDDNYQNPVKVKSVYVDSYNVPGGYHKFCNGGTCRKHFGSCCENGVGAFC